MTGHTFATDELIKGSYPDELRESLYVDPRMHDFREGTFQYSEPTENMETKIRLLEANLTEYSKVVTVVGGGWPLIYNMKGASNIDCFDINIKQIRKFFSELEHDKESSIKFLNSLTKGFIKFHLRDLTNLEDPIILTSYSKATLIDLSNIFDYYNPTRALKRILSIYELMQNNSHLIISSLYKDRVQDFYDRLTEAGVEVQIEVYDTGEENDFIENFLIVKKLDSEASSE